ncbi:MAG TPA: helix-turn-helix transcriptional regulator [Ktedonobacteraceae bacterium]|nr:helix-turn-helix transcriptional regulator [Ktedonobacteraceae bacterium]
MALHWRLRQVMASRGVWSGAELLRLMEQKAGYKLSAPSMSALLTEAPRQVKAQTMDALCTALDCTPADLWHHTPSLIEGQAADKEEQGPPHVVNETARRVLPPL